MICIQQGEFRKWFYNSSLSIHRYCNVHSSGLVFVADSGNNCIQVLHPDLSLFHKIGIRGNGPGQFLATNDVAFDSRGIVYVTDYNNHRVQSFSADGQFISSFGNKGTATRPDFFIHLVSVLTLLTLCMSLIAIIVCRYLTHMASSSSVSVKRETERESYLTLKEWLWTALLETFMFVIIVTIALLYTNFLTQYFYTPH